jgi:protein MpaA
MGIAVLFSALALASPGVHERLVLGHSALGRPIVAVHTGNPVSTTRVLVVGCIHGTEDAGMAVTRRLAALPSPRRIDLWILSNLNPDGRALSVRQNGRGVDLNRNFSSGWRLSGSRWDPEYPGPHPFSEPETRIARSLILRIRPEVTLWFHQPQAIVRAWGKSIAMARRYARLAGAPFRRIRWPDGTAPNWQNHRFPGTSSFVVELPAGPLSRRAVRRYAAAILALTSSDLARSAPAASISSIAR